MDPLEAACRRRTLQDVLKIANEYIEYAQPIPCPEAKPGCCVLHTVTLKRLRTAGEIVQAIQSLLEETT